MTQPQTNEGKRIEYAPTVCGLSAAASVLSVMLDDDEDVQWCWTHYPEGQSVVTGYQIIKKKRDVDKEGFSFEKAIADWLGTDKNKDRDFGQESASSKSLNQRNRPVGFLSSSSARSS